MFAVSLPSVSAFSQWLRPISVLVYAGAAALAVWIVITWTAPPPESAPAMQSTPSAKFRMNQSAEARLFGVEVTGGLTPPSVKLVGVFASQAGTSGAAVMSVEGKPAVSYQIGEDVANGWKLSALGPQEAVLTRGGQRHKVSMPTLSVDTRLIRRVQ